MSDETKEKRTGKRYAETSGSVLHLKNGTTITLVDSDIGVISGDPVDIVVHGAIKPNDLNHLTKRRMNNEL